MLFLPYFVRTALLSRGADCLVEATPYKYTMKARQINSGFGHQCR
jgi:hypothetical protein